LRFSTAVLIEDSTADATLFLRIIEELGARDRFVWHESGRRFLDALPLKEIPDVIITDLSMPGLSGHELVKILRADPIFATLPIVMFSGSTANTDRHLAFNLGVDDYVVKPHSLEDYEDAVVRIVAEWIAYCGCEGERASVLVRADASSDSGSIV
jgi:CheY-like chemotaxis protein